MKTFNVLQAQAVVRMRSLTPERLDPSSPSPQKDFSLCGRGTAFGPASQSQSWSLCPQPQSPSPSASSVALGGQSAISDGRASVSQGCPHILRGSIHLSCHTKAHAPNHSPFNKNLACAAISAQVWSASTHVAGRIPPWLDSWLHQCDFLCLECREYSTFFSLSKKQSCIKQFPSPLPMSPLKSSHTYSPDHRFPELGACC